MQPNNIIFIINFSLCQYNYTNIVMTKTWLKACLTQTTNFRSFMFTIFVQINRILFHLYTIKIHNKELEYVILTTNNTSYKV